MRLLTKNEIVQIQTQDRQREIAEGLKLSRRVDALREVKAHEEQDLENFRKATLEGIQMEISTLEGKRNKVAAEISILQVKLDSLLPGMETERRGLDEHRKTLDAKENELLDKEEKLDLLEIDIAEAIKNSQDAEKRALTREEEAKRLHFLASEEKEETSQILLSAKTIEEKALLKKEAVEKEAYLKNAQSLEKEKTIVMRETSSIEKERELRIKELRLEDQRKTLERSLERLRKNRLA